MKHTPGPWLVDREENETINLYTPQGGMELCTIRLSDQTEAGGEDEEADEALNEEMEANAFLIAAAPELLAALVALKMNSEANEGVGCWCNQRIGGQINFECRNTPYCRNVRAVIAKVTDKTNVYTYPETGIKEPSK